jgi:predicted MFS family arabinose efflux permease
VNEGVGGRPGRTDPPAGRPSAYAWLVLAVATGTQTSSAFAMQGLGVLAGFLQQALHLSAAQVGLLVTVAGAAPVVALLVVGHLLDRYDERLIIGLGAVVAAAGLGLAAQAGGYSVVLAGLFVLGIGYSTAQPGGSKSVAAWFPSARRGVAMGIRQAGLPLGGAAAALVLPTVAQWWGWHAAFAVTAAVVVAGGVVFGLVYRRPSTPALAAPRVGLLRGLATQLRSPALTSILLTGFVLVGAQYAVTTYFILFLHERNGLSLVRAALLFFVVQIAGGLGRIVLAAASDRTRGGRMVWIQRCMVATALLLALLPLVPANMVLGGALAALLGFFGYGWYGPWVAHVTETSPPHQVGLALGAAMAVNQVAIVGVPPLLGLLADLTSYSVMWWCLAALLGPLVGCVRMVRSAGIQ